MSIDVGNMDVDMEGVIVGLTLDNLEGNNVGATVPVGSHSNTYLSYEFIAILDIKINSISPLK